MIQFSEQLIQPGTATQINLKPILSYTTDDAISTFTPNERNCYANGEANLTYLPYNLGFRYEMNNCLIDQAIRDIEWNCRCINEDKDKFDIIKYSSKYCEIDCSVLKQGYEKISEWMLEYTELDIDDYITDTGNSDLSVINVVDYVGF